MKKTITLFIFVVSVLFIVTGALIFKAFRPASPIIEFNNKVFLNTDNMLEADTVLINHSYRRTIIKAYLFGGKAGNYINAADLFVCTFLKDSLQKKPDTILLIDTKLQGPLTVQPYEYYFETAAINKSRGCSASLPREQIPILKKYRYRYAHVTLVLDD